jgi:hypothetical protein
MILICYILILYTRSKFMLGHVLGAASEVPVRYICGQMTNSTATCSTAAAVIHDGIVEPLTDAALYGTLSGGIYSGLNVPVIVSSIIGSISTKYAIDLTEKKEEFCEVIIGTIDRFIEINTYEPNTQEAICDAIIGTAGALIGVATYSCL